MLSPPIDHFVEKRKVEGPGKPKSQGGDMGKEGLKCIRPEIHPQGILKHWPMYPCGLSTESPATPGCTEMNGRHSPEMLAGVQTCNLPEEYFKEEPIHQREWQALSRVVTHLQVGWGWLLKENKMAATCWAQPLCLAEILPCQPGSVWQVTMYLWVQVTAGRLKGCGTGTWARH
ncbi:hypothetical protein FA13DRAFT_1716537 [Coprinellus micaceus]|uniref:Uncharacterized protein n=1 Tax=Coprinellus micaceus TaxID=71717 RepID=A0A4Y7SIV5_COPMI|nr:hypothetical protein FA13DRAFT_1716537 [Coprinellus micaceus]